MNRGWVIQLDSVDGIKQERNQHYLASIRRTAPDEQDEDGTLHLYASLIWAQIGSMKFPTRHEARQIAKAINRYMVPKIRCHVTKRIGPIHYSKMRVFLGDKEISEVIG